MEIHYTPLTKEDIPFLTPIMKSAFDADTRMHTDLLEDGPWGYDTGELLQCLLEQEHSTSAVIWNGKQRIGEYTVIQKEQTYHLDMLFIDPGLASKGIGHRVWKDIEKTYSDAEDWMVETPAYSARNLHFYEKCGFQRIEEFTYSDGAKSVILKKHCQKGPVSILKYCEERDYEKILESCKKEGWEPFCTTKKEPYRQALQNSLTYVAYSDGVYCGFIRCITDGTFTTYCCEILVEDTCRRMGVGKALLNTVSTAYPQCCVDVLSDGDAFYQANHFLYLGSGMRKLPHP